MIESNVYWVGSVGPVGLDGTYGMLGMSGFASFWLSNWKLCFCYVFGNRGNVVGFCNIGSNGNIMDAW